MKTHRLFSYFIFLVPLVFVFNSNAGLFKCVDAEGGVTYSDQSCDGGEDILVDVAVDEQGLTREDGSPLVVPQPVAAGNSIEEKNRQAIDNCILHHIDTGHFPDPDPSSVIVKTQEFKWVGVDMVGARRMLYLTVNPKNRYGAFDGFQQVECLLMGDNITINKGEYKLLD